MKKTRIVCTLGPASSSPEVIEKLIKAGMDVARLNFSHGTERDHSARIRLIRETANRLARPVAILADIAGPKIRIGEIAGGAVELETGRKFVLTSRDVPGDAEAVSVSYLDLPRLVKKGDIILLSDGSLELEVLSISPDRINCRVTIGGTLSSRKGINLPTRSSGIPILTEKDKQDLKFIARQGLDFIGLSFVRTGAEVAEVRNWLKRRRCSTPLIAKIEKPQAVENIGEIIAAADGVMVARGDLGVEIPFAEVPIIQKKIIFQAHRAGKPVITATQMMMSMVSSPRPTRAEVSDVAGAIFDGTDAVMLSEETAAGKYPVRAVEAMASIAGEVEADPVYRKWIRDWIGRMLEEQEMLPVEESVARSACFLAAGINADRIIVHTASGSAARRVAKYRPAAPILAVTSSEEVYRSLALTWGTEAILIPAPKNFEEMIARATAAGLKSGQLKKGDRAVVTAGVPINHPGHTNVIRVVTIGQPDKTF
ncbi:MAG: pyruvate kinase [Candidatus Erginobacter occultus]|nr:pyruvate kinase [Candidatus Erginobacter occultus]